MQPFQNNTRDNLPPPLLVIKGGEYAWCEKAVDPTAFWVSELGGEVAHAGRDGGGMRRTPSRARLTPLQRRSTVAPSSLGFSRRNSFSQLWVTTDWRGFVHPSHFDPMVAEGGASLPSHYRRLAGKSQTVRVTGHGLVQGPLFMVVDAEALRGRVTSPTRAPISSLHRPFKHRAFPLLSQTAARGIEEPCRRMWICHLPSLSAVWSQASVLASYGCCCKWPHV